MGYYSDFHVDDTDIDGIKEVLNQYTEPYDWYDYDGLPYTHGKWYDWLKDLAILAADHPDNFLIVIRYGEEQPDISRAVVKNGYVIEQKAVITWPEL